MSAEFGLSSELRGHEEDVREIFSTIWSCLTWASWGPLYRLGTFYIQVRTVLDTDLGIVTGSRDKTLKVWERVGQDFVVSKTLVSAFTALLDGGNKRATATADACLAGRP